MKTMEPRVWHNLACATICAESDKGSKVLFLVSCVGWCSVFLDPGLENSSLILNHGWRGLKYFLPELRFKMKLPFLALG